MKLIFHIFVLHTLFVVQYKTYTNMMKMTEKTAEPELYKAMRCLAVSFYVVLKESDCFICELCFETCSSCASGNASSHIPESKIVVQNKTNRY